MAKNPKGRGGTSTLRLVSNSGPKTLSGASPRKPTGPKPIQLTAEQEGKTKMKGKPSNA